MAVEPKTVRETNFVMASIEERVAELRKMILGMYGLLTALVGGAFALYFQIGDLKTDVAVIKANVTTINERVAKIDKSIDDVRSAENLASTALGRIEASLNSGAQGAPRASSLIAGLTLSTGEIQLIRDTLKPVNKGAPQRFKVGDPLEPGTFVMLLPNSITAKFPRLSGLLYFGDLSGAIMLVAGAAGYNVIVGVVTPA